MSRALATLACSAGVTLLYREPLHAAQRVLQRDDSEALHDLRVALRRLQVAVEIYADERQAQEQLLPLLRRLINKTNRNRDAEVMLAWLQMLWPGLDEPSRCGAKRWRKQLLRCQRRGATPAALAARLTRLVPYLDKLPLRSGLAGLTLGQAAAQQLLESAAQVDVPLKNRQDERTLHQLRLRVKRVRYLLVPFRDELSACRDAEEKVRQWQELLGNWHDSVICRQSLTNLLAAEGASVSSRMERVLAEGSSPVLREVAPRFAGLLTLARLNYRREQEALAALQCLDITSFLGTLQQAAAELQHTSAA